MTGVELAGVTGAALTPVRRGQRALREIGLAVLVAAVSWGVAWLALDPGWGCFEGLPDSVASWALLAGTVLLALLRLRFPAVAFLGAAALLGLWPAAGGVVALTAFRAAGWVRPERRLWITVALAAPVELGVALLFSQYGWSIVVAGHAAALLVCVGLPIGVQALLGKADRLVAALRERTHYLEDNYRLAHSAARLQERSRIAQEMHDQLGHRLSLISLYAGALELATASHGRPGYDGTGRASAEPGTLQTEALGTDEARLIRGTVQDAMQELRSTLGMLRSDNPDEAELQPVAQTGTRTDLAQLVAESRSAGVPVELTWHGDDLAEAPLPARRAAHRLVREGLTNIHRHAPGAAAEVVVDRRAGLVRIEVRSGPPGTACRTPGTGLGLVGVQERVRLVGGVFSAGATTGGGFLLRADLPLAEPSTAPGPAVESGRGIPPRAPGRHARRRLDNRRGIATVLAAGLVGLPALVTVVLDGAVMIVPGSTPYDEAFETPRIGMTRAAVESAMGTEDPLTRLAAQAVETPRPPGTTCLYSRNWDAEDQDMIIRYCFRDGRLAVLDQFVIKPGNP